MNDGNDTLLWPFDGPLHELFQPGKIVISETYPAECYGWFFGPLKGKGKQEVRRMVSAPLLERAQSIGLELEPDLVAAIQCGFPEGDDAFDAVVGLFGMVEVVTGKRQSGEPKEERVRQSEGWILGQTSETSLTLCLIARRLSLPAPGGWKQRIRIHPIFLVLWTRIHSFRIAYIRETASGLS